MSKSVLDTLYSVKKCLIDSLSVLSEVVSAWGPTQRTTHAEYLDHSNRPGILGPGSERFLTFYDTSAEVLPRRMVTESARAHSSYSG